MVRNRLQFGIALLITLPLVGAAPLRPAAAGDCAASNGSNLSFAVIGDYGADTPGEGPVAAMLASWAPDLILTVGDNNYPSGGAATIDANIGKYYHDFICPYTGTFGSGSATNRFLPALGNHDWVAAGAQPYLDYFALPGNERYYQVVHGPVHFFIVDSDPHEPDGIDASSVQAHWLQAALAASTSPWNIVLMHHAPYSSSSTHGSNAVMRWPYQEWGADAVLAGHDHTYERLDIGGIPYIVDGLGGYTKYDFGDPLPGSQARYQAKFGALRVDATTEQLRFRFFDQDGEVQDDYTLAQPGGVPDLTASSTPLPLVPADLYFENFISGLALPVLATNAGDGSGRIFVVEQAGRIRIVKNGALLGTPFLDIRTDVRTGGERGLLALAFHPSYEANGYFYVMYTAPRTDDPDGSVLTLKRFSVSGNANLADAASGQVLLGIDHPSRSNHNGGTLAFGSDGYLYWSTGDGGGGGDPSENAQDLTKLLGKVLRLDVDAATPYAIPAGNPFVESPVDDQATLAEIWAYGLRNPWRMSFDRGTGDLYIGDVGQGLWEEIDHQPASSTGGENYGWDQYEGNAQYNPPFEGPYDPTDKTFPVAVYPHSLGCSVNGGHVYRGTNFPSLIGHYFYGDFCTTRIWDLYYDDGLPGWVNSEVRDLPQSFDMSSWGEDEDGSLYIVLRSSGSLLRIGYQDPLAFEGVRPMPADGSSVCTTPGIGADLILSDATRDAAGRFDLSKVKLRLDGTDVTASATVRVATTHPNSRAALLYTPTSPLALGSHMATLTYAAADGPLTAAWDFTVTSGPCTTSAQQLSAAITETAAPQFPVVAATDTPAPDTAEPTARSVIEASPTSPAPTISATATPAQAVLPAPTGLLRCLPWDLSCPRMIRVKP